MRKQYLHHFVLGQSEMLVDHRDGDGLNNQRSNLRLSDFTSNQGNARMRKDNTSGYKGVQRSSTPCKWTASCAGRSLGVYTTKEDAAVAYDCGAISRFGEHAFTNFNVWRYITGNDLILFHERGVI